MLDEEIVPSKEKDDFDLIKHQRSLISMFGGETEEVTFESSISVLDAIYDKFGDGIDIRSKGDDKIEFSVEVQISNPFLAWVCGFGETLKVTAPQSVVERIKEHIQQALKNYTE